jgi:hypothetical protein
MNIATKTTSPTSQKHFSTLIVVSAINSSSKNIYRFCQ